MKSIPETAFHIDVSNRRIKCVVRQSRKAKYIQIRIDQVGYLELVVPVNRSVSEARFFLQSKIQWVRDNLHLIREIAPDEYYLFGEKITVIHSYELFRAKHGIIWEPEARILRITSPEGSPAKTVELYKVYLKNVAAKYLVPRTRLFAHTYNFKPQKVMIRAQKTRWGSCSNDKTISLNYNLVRFRPEVIDYLIVHELCHLRYMDHSQRFWNEVAKIVPEYKTLRKELKGMRMV